MAPELTAVLVELRNDAGVGGQPVTEATVQGDRPPLLLGASASLVTWHRPVQGSRRGANAMTAMSPFVAGPPEDRSRPWRVVTDGSASNGMALGDARIAPGAPGPGRHVHTHEDEGIYVVAGVLTVEVGQERYEVGPESFIWLPREVPHVFANLGTEEVWTVGLLSSPGLTGMFHEQAEYFASLQGPPDPDVLLEISLRYGVRPVEGPPLA